MQGGQVRQDPVLPDGGVLRPTRVRKAGGDVAVTVPVGGLAIKYADGAPGRQDRLHAAGEDEGGQELAGAQAAADQQRVPRGGSRIQAFEYRLPDADFTG